MEELIRSHKDLPFEWVLWLPMMGLWAQAALSALGRKRGKRDDARKPAAPKPAQGFDATCPPRLMAPR